MRTWTPHDLRRTAASKMRSLGVDRRVVQGILNHKD
jgi:integrase